MIKFYGFNNGKAIAVNNHKNMMNAFWISLFPALILSVIALIFEPIALIPIWIMPIMFLLFACLAFTTEKYDETVFLHDQKKKDSIHYAKHHDRKCFDLFPTHGESPFLFYGLRPTSSAVTRS